MRELYEEVSLLPCYKDNKFTILDREALKESRYSTVQFSKFCKDLNIIPAIDKLYAYRRMSPPHHANMRRIDTYNYMYFLENDEEDHLYMNPDEFTDADYMTPRKAFEDYYSLSKQIFFPQIFELMWISQIKEYDEFKDLVINNTDKMLISYLEFRGNVFSNNPKYFQKEGEDRTALMNRYYKNLFNKYDYWTDEQRKKDHGLIIFNENAHIDDLTGLIPVTEDAAHYGNHI